MLHSKNELQDHLGIDSTVLKVWKDNGLPSKQQNGIEAFDLPVVLEWLEEQRAEINTLNIGSIYDNQTVRKIFACAPQGGMRRSKLTNTLVLFSDHTTGIYDDKSSIDTDGNEILLYTGMGQDGDQDINYMQNKTLKNSNQSSVRVYLFEAFRPKEHIYRGEVKLVADPYESEQYNRKVWIFPVGFIDEKIVVTEELTEERNRNQEKEAKKLSDKDLYERAKKVETVGKRRVVTQAYARNTHITAHVKRRAAGYCDLCSEPAPFLDRNGQPFLECHHVEWLSRGGEDSIDNAVALDPSCHRKMHELDRKEDVEHLKSKIQKYYRLANDERYNYG